MRGSGKSVVEQNIPDGNEFTIEAWFSCSEEIMKTNMMLKHAVTENKIKFEANKDYYLS